MVILFVTLFCLTLGTVWTNSCFDGQTTGVSASPRLHLGFLADNTRRTKLDPRIININCNVTLEWFYTDYTEPYQLFKTIRLVTQREDIDLVILLDFDQQNIQWASILDTKHNNIIKLHRRSGNLNEPSLRLLVSQLTNGTYDISRHVNTGNINCQDDFNATEKTSDDPYFTDTVMFIPPLILANLAAQQEWKSTIVIYDTKSEYVARLFLDNLSQNGILYAPYNYDQVDDFHSVLFDMYNLAVNRDQKIYISVTCSLECLFKVLDIANNFDMRNTELPTLLSQFSRWLLLVYDYTPVVAKVIETIAHDLDNVAVVPVPEFNPPSLKSIITQLTHTLIDLNSLEFETEHNRKEMYIQNITQVLVTIDKIASCTSYNIDSLFWTISGRKLQTLGTADLQGGVDMHSTELFPNTQYGYSKRLFKVGTHVFCSILLNDISLETSLQDVSNDMSNDRIGHEWNEIFQVEEFEQYSPYVTKSINENNETEFGGIYIDLLVELSRVLNFTFYIVEPADDKWGVVEAVVNGTEVWNGMVGMLQRREVDLIAAPLTIIPARDKIIDFSYPVSYEYTTIVVKQPDPNAVKWKTLINPFKLEVLLYIGVSLPVVTVLVCLIEKFGPYYSDSKNRRIRKEAGGLHHLHDAFWYMYGALLCQGGVRLPDSFAGRTYVSAWWIFCIIIVATYCGNLIAFLTVSKEISPFNTLEEMVALKGTYKWGTMAGTVLETVFVTSSNPQLRKIGDAMLEFNSSDPDIFHESMDFHRARVRQGFYAWIADTTTIELLMSSSCDLTTIKERLLPMKDAFAFQHNSPHTLVFSQQIMKSHEAGLFEIWRRKWWPKRNFCTDKAKFESKPITLRDVQSGFYLCVIGIFFGTVAFVAEIVIFKIRKRRTVNRTSDNINDVHDLDINITDILY